MKSTYKFTMGALVGAGLATTGLGTWTNHRLDHSASMYGKALTAHSEMVAERSRIANLSYDDLYQKLKAKGWSDSTASAASLRCAMLVSSNFNKEEKHPDE